MKGKISRDWDVFVIVRIDDTAMSERRYNLPSGTVVHSLRKEYISVASRWEYGAIALVHGEQWMHVYNRDPRGVPDVGPAL